MNYKRRCLFYQKRSVWWSSSIAFCAKALEWLVAHAPAHKDVIVCPERLGKLPVGGELNVSVFEPNHDSLKGTEDLGTLPEQVPVEMETRKWIKLCTNDATIDHAKNCNEKDAEGNHIPYHTVIGEDVDVEDVGKLDKWRTPEGLVEPNALDENFGQEFTFDIVEGEEQEDC